MDSIVDLKRNMGVLSFSFFIRSSCWRVLGQSMAARPKVFGFGCNARSQAISLLGLPYLPYPKLLEDPRSGMTVRSIF